MKKIVFTVLVIALIALVGCTSQTQTKDVETVDIGSFSRAIDYAPYLVAKNQGWFEEVATKYDTTVKYTEFQSLPPINEGFATGNIDIVFEAEPPAIIGKAAGINIQIKGVGASLVQEILVHKDSEIKSVADLKGKKIAVLAGTSSHYGLLKILEQNGITAEDVEIMDMIPPDANAAFESNQVDAWAVWPPWVEQQVIAGKGRTLDGGDAFIQSIVAVRGDFVNQNPELSTELLQVIEKSKTWIGEHESEAQSIVAQELDLSLEVVVEAWPKHNFQAKIEQKELDDIQAKADFFYENNLIKNQVSVDDLVILR